jgi:hypothetical protein
MNGNPGGEVCANLHLFYFRIEPMDHCFFYRKKPEKEAVK